MFATGKNGGQRLIPKYARLKVLGEGCATPDRKNKTLAKVAVLEAFEAFYATCRQLAPDDRHPELSAARGRFMKALGVTAV